MKPSKQIKLHHHHLEPKFSQMCTFFAYVGMHKVRILVFENYYQLCPVPLIKSLRHHAVNRQEKNYLVRQKQKVTPGMSRPLF